MTARPKPWWFRDPDTVDYIEHQLSPVDTFNVHHSFAHRHRAAATPRERFALQYHQKKLNRDLGRLTRRKRVVVHDEKIHHGSARLVIY